MILKKIMSYLTEYSYGNIGTYPARKFLLTGSVQVFHENTWIKATREASKQFVEQEIDPASAVAPQHQAPAVAKKKAPVRRVNAATIAEEDEAPPLPEPDPLPDVKKGKGKKKLIAQQRGNAITPAQARANAEREQTELMRNLPPPKLKSTPPTEDLLRQEQDPNVLGPITVGDADGLAQRVHDLADILAEIQPSSAGGHQRMRQVITAMREAANAYNGDMSAEGVGEA